MMSNAAESYLRTLQALSGNIDLSAARKALLSGIDGEGVLVVVLQVVTEMPSRYDQEELVLFALDKTSQSQQSAGLSRVPFKLAAVDRTTGRERSKTSDSGHQKALKTCLLGSHSPKTPSDMVSPSSATAHGPMPPTALHHQPQHFPHRSVYTPTAPAITTQIQPVPSRSYVSPSQSPALTSCSSTASMPAQQRSVAPKPTTTKPNPALAPPAASTQLTWKRPWSPEKLHTAKRAKVGYVTPLENTHSTQKDTTEIVKLELDSSSADNEHNDEVSQHVKHNRTSVARRPSARPTLYPVRIATSNLALHLRVFATHFGVDTSFSYKPLGEQPALSKTLYQKFETDFWAKKEHKDRYHTILANVEVYIGDYQCLDMRIQSAQRENNCTYSMSEYRKEYACDRCILRRKLCIKPAKLDGKAQLVVHPLPLKLRGGVKWQDVSY